ncbi:MAG TPA: type II toxin-antitoxin system Phd/YefM family antitoxin [Anaeromyxobacteraceae bacterium]|nr:type II toxin-antitoxin system Phd/YefM family antitoxin [Anaeromyxobacteraceae bacterium]
MKVLRVSEDVVPIGEFKAQAKKWLARARETGQPLVITQNGHPAAVMLSPAEYDRLTERQRFLDEVAAGLEDAKEGRLIDLGESRARLARRHKRVRR